MDIKCMPNLHLVLARLLERSVFLKDWSAAFFAGWSCDTPSLLCVVKCNKLLAAEVATCVSRDPELDKEFKIISTGEATAGVVSSVVVWGFWSFQNVLCNGRFPYYVYYSS